MKSLGLMINESAKNQRWRPAPEIKKELAKSPQLENIREAASLRIFFRHALFPKEYKPAPEWAQMVVLSHHGEEALKLCGFSNRNEEERAEVAMAMFCLFFHHELLIDCGKCNLKGINTILHHEMVTMQLRWPHRFGHLLYKKFNDHYTGDRTDHLLPEEAWSLVDGTPNGVYQVGSFVSGPLGLIAVKHYRYVPPSREVLLWHCSDPGCHAAHAVELMQIQVPIVKMVSEGRNVLNAQFGPVSEWTTALADVMGRDIPRQPYTYFDVCALVADGVVATERTSLVTAALRGGKSNFLRDALSSPPRKKNAGQGSPEALAVSLGSEEQLQLLFLLDDSELVNLVDKSIEQGSIGVPLAEIRSSKNTLPTPNRIPTSEISSLGIRCSGSEPLLDFWALLWEAYSCSNKINELDWRLHNRTGSATQNVLLDYLSKNEPVQAVRELVLASEPITKVICEKLYCGLEELTENKFVDKMLWKLGFDIPRFTDTLQVLRRRLELFNQELLAVGELHTERDRERIRSAGVNLFVSLEEFLNQVVSYNVWLLASDHFLSTRFRYDWRSARHNVAQVLGSSIGSGESEVKWNSEKTNTLGTLMSYLNAAVSWMRTLPGSVREKLVRPEADLPHFADYKFRVFPFRHTALWADSDLSSLKRFAEEFAAIAAKVSRSNLAGIRNGLDHHRDEAGFPKMEEMLAFVAYFREAVDISDVNRFFPKEFWLEKMQTDRFGRGEYMFKDYVGRSHTFFGPPFVHGLPGAGVNMPMIIAPGNLLGCTNAEIVVRINERSVYSDYWQNYPQRRQIPNHHQRLADLQFTATQPQTGSEAITSKLASFTTEK